MMREKEEREKEKGIFLKKVVTLEEINHGGHEKSTKRLDYINSLRSLYLLCDLRG